MSLLTYILLNTVSQNQLLNFWTYLSLFFEQILETHHYQVLSFPLFTSVLTPHNIFLNILAQFQRSFWTTYVVKCILQNPQLSFSSRSLLSLNTLFNQCFQGHTPQTHNYHLFEFLLLLLVLIKCLLLLTPHSIKLNWPTYLDAFSFLRHHGPDSFHKLLCNLRTLKPLAIKWKSIRIFHHSDQIFLFVYHTFLWPGSIFAPNSVINSASKLAEYFIEDSGQQLFK